MGLPHIPYRCQREYPFHHLSPVHWTSWKLQPRAMRSGSSHRRRSPSLRPFFHCRSAEPHHHPTTLLATRRFICAPAIHFFLVLLNLFLGSLPILPVSQMW